MKAFTRLQSTSAFETLTRLATFGSTPWMVLREHRWLKSCATTQIILVFKKSTLREVSLKKQRLLTKNGAIEAKSGMGCCVHDKRSERLPRRAGLQCCRVSDAVPCLHVMTAMLSHEIHNKLKNSHLHGLHSWSWASFRSAVFRSAERIAWYFGDRITANISGKQWFQWNNIEKISKRWPSWHHCWWITRWQSRANFSAFDSAITRPKRKKKQFVLCDWERSFGNNFKCHFRYTYSQIDGTLLSGTSIWCGKRPAFCVHCSRSNLTRAS